MDVEAVVQLCKRGLGALSAHLKSLMSTEKRKEFPLCRGVLFFTYKGCLDIFKCLPHLLKIFMDQVVKVYTQNNRMEDE